MDYESKDLLSRARLSLCNYAADLRGDARRIGPPKIEIGVVERLISDIEATAKTTESKSVDRDWKPWETPLFHYLRSFVDMLGAREAGCDEAEDDLMDDLDDRWKEMTEAEVEIVRAVSRLINKAAPPHRKNTEYQSKGQGNDQALDLLASLADDAKPLVAGSWIVGRIDAVCTLLRKRDTEHQSKPQTRAESVHPPATWHVCDRHGEGNLFKDEEKAADRLKACAEHYVTAHRGPWSIAKYVRTDLTQTTECKSVDRADIEAIDSIVGSRVQIRGRWESIAGDDDLAAWSRIRAALCARDTECRSVALEAAVLLRDAASVVGEDNSRLGVACEAMARRLESGSSAEERHNAAVASVMFQDDSWGAEGDR